MIAGRRAAGPVFHHQVRNRRLRLHHHRGRRHCRRAEIAGNAIDASKEDVSELSGIRTLNDSNSISYNLAGEIDAIMPEPLLRSEIFARAEAIKQLRASIWLRSPKACGFTSS